MCLINRLEEPSPFSFPRYVTNWGSLKLQKQVYQNCCQGMSTLFSVVPPALEKCVTKVRTFTVIDLCVVSSMKVTNELTIFIFKKPVFPAERVKTFSQKRHELALIHLKQKIGKETIYTLSNSKVWKFHNVS